MIIVGLLPLLDFHLLKPAFYRFDRQTELVVIGDVRRRVLISKIISGQLPRKPLRNRCGCIVMRILFSRISIITSICTRKRHNRGLVFVAFVGPVGTQNDAMTLLPDVVSSINDRVQSKCVHATYLSITLRSITCRRNMISVVFYVCFAALTVTPCFKLKTYYIDHRPINLNESLPILAAQTAAE